MQTPDLINAQASTWMKRGIALLTKNTAEALRESLDCFDAAISLRRALPLRESAWYRYVLAAGWMNRGDALTRLHFLDDAVDSYDEALVLLQTLDLGENPLFRKRLALAWMNRGVTRQKQESPAALISFENALAIAAEPSLRAASLTNLGNALLQFNSTDLPKTRDAFREALRLLADKELTDIDAAKTGLNARRGICRVIAFQLADAKTPDPDLVSDATDAAEEALRLIRHWQQRGEIRFRELALEMIHFGARAYQLYQPQFLTEFLTEMLPGHSRSVFGGDNQTRQNGALGGNQFANSFPAEREHLFELDR